MAARKRKRTTKADWFEAALRVLRTEGHSSVRVERLARDLDISKSGFYWHFRDRRDLELQLLDYWAHEYTEVLADNPELLLVEPRKRLTRVYQLVEEHDLAGYDLAFFGWAETDPVVRERVERVIQRRLDYQKRALAELGIKGDEADFRNRVFICYMAWQRTLPTFSARKSKLLEKRMIEWLTAPPP